MAADLEPFLALFPAAAVLAMALAAAGAHLASRQRTLQSLCLAQGAELGALASAAGLIAADETLERAGSWMGLAGSLVGALAAGGLAFFASGASTASRTTRLFALWLLLVAGTHLSVSLHPSLESHLARVFLGDLATLSDAESAVVGGAGAVACALLAFGHRAFARSTFDVSALGGATERPVRRASELASFLVLPALSTWAAGFLFTCAFLFLPTALLSRNGDSSRTSVLLCASVSGITAPVALLLSLRYDALPTVPTMAALLALACFAIHGARSLAKEST